MGSSWVGWGGAWRPLTQAEITILGASWVAAWVACRAARWTRSTSEGRNNAARRCVRKMCRRTSRTRDLNSGPGASRTVCRRTPTSKRDRRSRAPFSGLDQVCGHREENNPVIGYRIYLTPGECGLPTRYTHPPPTPTPDIDHHCSAPATVPTLHFPALRRPYACTCTCCDRANQHEHPAPSHFRTWTAASTLLSRASSSSSERSMRSNRASICSRMPWINAVTPWPAVSFEGLITA